MYFENAQIARDQLNKFGVPENPTKNFSYQSGRFTIGVGMETVEEETRIVEKAPLPSFET